VTINGKIGAKKYDVLMAMEYFLKAEKWEYEW